MWNTRVIGDSGLGDHVGVETDRTILRKIATNLIPQIGLNQGLIIERDIPHHINAGWALS